MSLALANSNLAFADSGASAMPPKDSALHQSYYKMYAPKNQKTFKEFATVTQAVETIKKQNEDFIFYGGMLMGGGTLASSLVKASSMHPMTAVGIRVVNGVGATMVLIGSFGQISFKDLQKGSVIKYKVYFRWSNPEKLEYDTKIESWVEYKGKRISQVRTSQYSKRL